MIKKRFELALAWMKKVVRKRFEKIFEINAKYRQPRIKMTAMTRILLLVLRIYLILLVLVLVYKFITIITAR